VAALALQSSGYSSRTLPEKLGFKPAMRAAFVALPDTLSDLPGSVDFRSVDQLHRWADVAAANSYDAIHAFTTDRVELDLGLATLQRAIKPAGMIWVSWPKKASKIETEVTEDVVREAALRLDLVDVKVVAIDAVWSGLKLMIRKEKRP
jgi:hypothetical protein